MEYVYVLSFLSTAGGAALLTHLFSKHKQHIETQHLLGKTYVDIIDSMRREIDRLKEKIIALEKREQVQSAQIEVLEKREQAQSAQIESLKSQIKQTHTQPHAKKNPIRRRPAVLD